MKKAIHRAKFPSGDTRSGCETEPTSNASWIPMAIAARAEIKRVHQGVKADVLHRIGVENGISDGMLRKCITALHLLEKLEEEGLPYPRTLRTAQAGVMEVFGRWMKHDFAGAVRAVEAHGRGETTFRDLQKGESEARKRLRRGVLPPKNDRDLPTVKSMPALLDRARLKAIIIEAIMLDVTSAQSLAMVAQILTRRSIEARSENDFKVRGSW